ncbi:MAG: ATP-dependent helicase [Candidatus Nanopelagicales bacterium]
MPVQSTAARGPAGPAEVALDWNPAQRRVLTSSAGSLLVLAGPGVGKTSTLVEVVRRGLAGPPQLSAEQALVFTYSRPAAQAWRDRLAAQLPPGAALPEVATFHSFAFGLLRSQADPLAGEEPLRLLTSAEQEARVRELLNGAQEAGRLEWPAGLAGTAETHGIAREVRELLARARGMGLDGRALRRLGRSAGVPAWQFFGPFLDEYLDVLGFEGTIDYGELLYRAVALVADQRRGAHVRAQYRLIVVDEYQEVEPIQVALLRGLASQGARLVVAGDPDQAIFGFRGADARALLNFPERFPDAFGNPAELVVLDRAYRCPPAIRSAAAGVRGWAALPPLPAQVVLALRAPTWAAEASAEPGGNACGGPPDEPIASGRLASEVAVRTFDSTGGQAAAICDALWRERGQGRSWSDLAVLVRSPGAQLPVLGQALSAAGIPIWSDGGDLPLAQQGAVAELLRWLCAAIGEVEPGWAAALLTGPIGQVAPVELRVRIREMAPPATAGSPGLNWHETLVCYLNDPHTLPLSESPTPPIGEPATPPTGWGGRQRVEQLALFPAEDELAESAAGTEEPDAVVTAIRRCAELLAAIRAQLATDASAHQVLWTTWSGSGWPADLRAAALAGGAAGRRADRQLDSVLAVFDVAARLPTQAVGVPGLRALLAEVRAREIPTDSRASRPRTDAVALLSAHRAKGQSWPVVVIAGVQEGRWPNVLRRSRLLRTDELGAHGVVEALGPAAALAEERRLFYTAATRAKQRLWVTAVSDPSEGGLRPSRFLSELGVTVESGSVARGYGEVSEAGVVTRLREVAWSATRSGDQTAAQAAAARLAALSANGHLAQADPARWWDVAASTPGAIPVVGPGAPIKLSGSAVAALGECPLRWFLDRRVGATSPRSDAMAVGLLLHALAEQVVTGALPGRPADLDSAVDAVWAGLPAEAPYQSEREHERVRRMIRSLLAWHTQAGREPIAVEHHFDVALSVPTPIGELPIRLRGFIDRIDRDADGGLHLVDFKTAKTPVARAAALDNPQLAVYQLAAQAGALAGLDHPSPCSALRGAELVFLSEVSRRTGLPTIRSQPALGERREWALGLLADAAVTLATEEFTARPGDHCGRCPHRRMCPAHRQTMEVRDETD